MANRRGDARRNGTVDVRKWLLIPRDKLWRVVAVAIGLDPDEMVSGGSLNLGFEVNGIVQYPKKFWDCLQVAEANLDDRLEPVKIVERDGHRYFSIVSFAAFAGFAMGTTLPVDRKILSTLAASGLPTGGGRPIARKETVTVELPYSSRALDGLFRIVWDNFDPENPPKQGNIAAEIDTLMGWKPEKDGKPSRGAAAVVSMIRPDNREGADGRRRPGKRGDRGKK